MPSFVHYYERIDSIVVIGNYAQRRWGRATFTTDSVEALSAGAPEINCWEVAMNGRHEG